VYVASSVYVELCRCSVESSVGVGALLCECSRCSVSSSVDADNSMGVAEQVL
jgi:hypothetical protein